MIVYVVSADYGLNGHAVLYVSTTQPTDTEVRDLVDGFISFTGFSGVEVSEHEVV